ncbi:MAG: dockerin type I repeat-containing protein [candidate division Zixibacteria bacterium]|nr:dockerin type I repeat-containing protein [candidate division Zixibacteria bacterium]
MLVRLWLFCFLLVWVLPLPVLADWDPADGHKMHFPQLPDEIGWDVNATQPVVLADDWQCSETGYVKDIHFWGSWKGGLEGAIQSFVLSIHADIPAEQSPTGYSMPGATLWEYTVTDFVPVPIDPPTMEGWYDPSTGLVLNNDHGNYYQYNVFLPREQWFFQQAGTIYWLNISAIVVGPQDVQWGWKSTTNHWNDDAVWANWGSLNWVEMYEPTTGPIINPFFISIDPAGNFAGGGGGGAYGAGWYHYPSGWWNIWFYDDPLKYNFQKHIHIDCFASPMVPTMPSNLTIAINWSTDVWSNTGNPPGDRRPPLPGEDEAAFIGRQIIWSGPVAMGQQIAWDGPVPANYCPEWVSVDVQGFNFMIESGNIMHDCLDQQSLDLSFVITGGTDVCEYYKPPYPDYAPVGMPDFDQKQNGWMDPVGQRWSHCGPVALANCLWWFDSKFETGTVPPPTYSDHYPLVTSYASMLPLWDDHAPQNVIPFVDSLALYCGTNMMPQPGTFIHGLVAGAANWIAKAGLASDYTVSLLPLDLPGAIDSVRKEVLRSQDVILLLGFWEINPADPGGCHRVGGHYVTVAGVCTTEVAICISDPWLDHNEGEPPAGSAHGSAVHNDAQFISGPHGTMDHDKYSIGAVSALCAASPFRAQVRDYPMTGSDIFMFQGMNNGDIPSQPYTGGQIITVAEYAVIICPAHVCDCRPGDADGSGMITISDAVYLINYIFAGGAAPTPYKLCSGDADCNCLVTISDAVYLINYIFAGGPAPCDCPTWLGICGPPLRK